ncbi:TIGR03086 family metal-binding protein [Catelliglobosispora koreensis]|uniref:TIGR03086 family metal-binding protein n=1 Tax=Catelliglobosispora koreensis TaxID=129052 RepID=UPI00036BEE65|nr:TIGR03086 family metal-binding protein [Catelliglobosispora koreensis]
MADIRAFHRRALETCAEIVDQVSDSQLSLATPCSQWSLRQLLAHMSVQNNGFAVAASGEKSDLASWHPEEDSDDPVHEFRASAEALLTAFADDEVLTREFWLPELSPDRPFPAEQAIGFHFVDSIVHGWDVAASIGVPASFDLDLVEAVRPFSLAVPGGDSRQRPGSVFAQEVTASSESTLDIVLAWLGRDPAWQPA